MPSSGVFFHCSLAGLLLTGILLAPQSGSAHPLGNFSISHYAEIRVEQNVIKLLYLIDMAEIPTFQQIQETGIVPKEGHTSLERFLAQKTETLQEGLLLELNGQRLQLQGEGKEVIFPPGAGGLPTLKLGILYRASFEGSAPTGFHLLRYRDANFAGRAGWKEIVALGGQGIVLVSSSVPDKDRSFQLADYPTDLLNSPPQDLEAHVVFTREGSPHAVGSVGSPKAQAPLPKEVGSEGRMETEQIWLRANSQATPRNSFTELVATKELGVGIVLIAIAVAAGLGAFHALEPGHGKTVVAAYLVGSRGTPWHALALGLIVTGSHTAGVYLIGAVTLFASRYVVPERLYPWLGVVSGLTIAGLGFSLFLRRYVADGHLHSHARLHDHGHSHHQGRARHSHGPTGEHGHTHGPHGDHHHETAATVPLQELVALGVTGGIVPCPAALVVLLSALSLQRVGFGLILIVAFSVGLAAVLIAIGLLMVYARHLMSWLRGDGLLISRWLPLASAVTITIFGVGIALQSLVSAGILHIWL